VAEYCAVKIEFNYGMEPEEIRERSKKCRKRFNAMMERLERALNCLQDLEYFDEHKKKYITTGYKEDETCRTFSGMNRIMEETSRIIRESGIRTLRASIQMTSESGHPEIDHSIETYGRHELKRYGM